MSIVSLKKLTVYGHQSDKEPVLADLQEMGCLHVIPLRRIEGLRRDEESAHRFREALKFLSHCPQHRPPHREQASFDRVVERANRTLELQHRLQALEDERDFLHRRIEDLRPWGDFVFPPLEERRSLRFWFYIVPHYQMKLVEETGLLWERVGTDGRFSYVVVIAVEEPQNMPVARTHTGSVPLSRLQQRLSEVEQALERIHDERVDLTRWRDQIDRNLARMEDEAALAETLRQTYDDRPVFVLQAWIPEAQVDRLQAYAAGRHLVVEVEDASREETPPTLLRNKPAVASGQDLVKFYMTPNYWFSDPSVVVFFSFILFFGMIVGDVGYGALLGLGVLLMWRRMGRSAQGRRFRVLFAGLVAATMAWGALVGSYFGVTPASGTLPAALHMLDMNDYDTMMRISILIGATHVMLANAVETRRRGWSWAALGAVGWIVIIAGGLMLGFDGGDAGYGLLSVGAVFILLFTGAETTGFRRLTKGLLGLTRITNAFGDVLSYLRLFALGLATSSLAITFNDLAGQALNAMPGLGLLFALVILLIGHILNFALALMSGFVHGLRLNFIEYFNWSAPEEGTPFRAFAKKETASWSP